MTRTPYDFYADMYQTHAEIGYLLWVAIALTALDLALALVLWRWPTPDVYLVPGIDAYSQVSVRWGGRAPVLPATSSDPAAHPAVAAVVMPGLPDPAPEPEITTWSMTAPAVQDEDAPAPVDQATGPMSAGAMP